MADRDRLLADVRRAVEAYCAAEHDVSFKPTAPKVRLHEPTFGSAEIMAALECLLSTQVTLGPIVRAFEADFAASVGLPQAVMNNSGSSANLLAVAALSNARTPDGLRAGDEVIVPALSWSTTVWPLIQCGLVPVVVDIDPATLNIDPAAVEAAIGPRTRGLMPVHVYGNPCDMTALVDICTRRNLILIEDCCEALGARYAGRPVGSFGRVGTFSFYFSHHITTLEGGICVTGDTALAELMRILRAHGWLREVHDPAPFLAEHPGIDPRFLFVDVGYNLRPTEPQAAMGRVQLPKLDDFVARRRATAAAMARDLAPVGDVVAVQQETPNGEHSWFGFPLILTAAASFSSGDMRRHLEATGIETRPLICGNIARQPGLLRYPHRVAGSLAHADAVMARGFSIPNHQAVDEVARIYMAGELTSYIESRRRA